MSYDISKLANTYKLLEKRNPPLDQEYVVYAYFLYSEPKDGVYGKHIYLGSYPTKKRALAEANNISKNTGHDSIYICEACSWEDIDEKVRMDRTIRVDSNAKSEDLDRQFDKFINTQRKNKEKEDKISKDLEEQTVKELDPTTLEHYAHNWYLAIKNKAEWEYHKQQMEHYKEMYDKRVTLIRDQYKNQPELDKEWLDVYKERLSYRGERKVFDYMEQGYNLLRDDILN
jgi:hypothetical protein